MQLHDLFSTCLRSPHHHTAALLQWLPVVAHIRFKTLMLAYKALITPHSAPHTLRSTALLHWSHHLSGSHPSSSSSQEANPCGSASSDPVRPDHKIMSSQNSDTYQGLDDMLRQELLQTPGQPLHPQIPTKNSATVVTVPMAKPTPYSGVAEECKGFLLQCSLIFEMQPSHFPRDRSKISFIISLLTEKRSGGPSPSGIKTDPFYIPSRNMQFRTLAAASGWDERALLTTYRNGLKPELLLQLSAFDDTMGLENFIQRAVRTESRMLSCTPNVLPQTHLSEPPSPGP
ncbi:uncharacterized protein LOC132844138 isoform X1 [Tachysurus vachellii]|uniref:uncharacterized protein LOC132844138 isoform X1 n=1 Tax=Tachysurus vachellii TaxID=175792 RepID=UPI00296B1AB0|nr:uncharacterized protein LOC132844138 isoform X1 [Tachysurus vachellii]